MTQNDSGFTDRNLKKGKHNQNLNQKEPISHLYNTINQSEGAFQTKYFNLDKISQLKKQLQYQTFDERLNKISQSVGVIKSNWFNNNKISSFIYGTAFLVGENTIMTCTHNVFSTSKKTFADQIQFIPNLKEQTVGTKYYEAIRIPASRKTDKLQDHIFSIFDLKIKPLLKSEVNFQICPTKYQICLIFFSEEHYNNNIIPQGIPIGWQKFQLCKPQQLESQQLEPQQLTVIGYPSQNFRSIYRFQEALVKRVQLTGVTYSIQSAKVRKNSSMDESDRNSIINYTMKTEVGMSGSPILALDKVGEEYYVIGIHTHRGRQPKYNSGVLFNPDFLEIIRQFEQNKMNKIKFYNYCKVNLIEKKEKGMKIEDIEEESEEEQGQSQKGYNNFSIEDIPPEEQPQKHSIRSEQSDHVNSHISLSDSRFKSKMNDNDDSLNSSIPLSDSFSNSEMSDLDGIYEYFTIINNDSFNLSLCQSEPTFSFNSIYLGGEGGY